MTTETARYPIAIDISGLDLDTVVEYDFGYDEDGEAFETEGRTLGEVVADKIAARIVAAKFRDYDIGVIRNEMIRAKLEPIIDAALNTPRQVYVDGKQVTRTFADDVSDEITRQIKAINSKDSIYSDRWASPVRQQLENAVAAGMKAETAQITRAVTAAIRLSIAREYGKTLAASIDSAAGAFRTAVFDATAEATGRP